MMVIHVTLVARDGARPALEAALSADAEVARQISGCQRFELLADRDRPERLVLVEEWATEEAFAAYKDSDAFRRAMAEVPPLLAEPPASLYVRGERVES